MSQVKNYNSMGMEASFRSQRNRSNVKIDKKSQQLESTGGTSSLRISSIETSSAAKQDESVDLVIC